MNFLTRLWLRSLLFDRARPSPDRRPDVWSSLAQVVTAMGCCVVLLPILLFLLWITVSAVGAMFNA